jgi:membrane protein YdbS with pleckstrin-like domain
MRKELLPGEQVIIVTRPQPRRLVFPAVVFIVVPALAAYAIAWIIRGGPRRLAPAVTSAWTPGLLGVCVAVAAFILLGYCLPRVLRWHGTQYILTSRRMVHRHGLLRRRDRQVPLAAVRNIGISQSLFQRMMRSGNISLDTGHPYSTTFSDVPEVVTFRNYILDAMDDLPEGDIFEAEHMTDYRGGRLPREVEEGGRDGR